MVLCLARFASANIILRVCTGRFQSLYHALRYHLLPLLQTSNYTFDPLEDMPADFGPRVPAEGVEGFLIVSVQNLSWLYVYDLLQEAPCSSTEVDIMQPVQFLHCLEVHSCCPLYTLVEAAREQKASPVIHGARLCRLLTLQQLVPGYVSP